MPAPGHKRIVISILLLALALKIALIILAGDRVYYDVNTALSYGRVYYEKGGVSVIGVLPGVKTYVGPVLWYQTYKHFGLYGLKAVSVAAFMLLFAFQYMIGRKLFSPRVTQIAMFIFAFYTWTNLNVIAGEQDDMMSAIFFTFGVLLYVHGRSVFLAALVMSAGLLFKYTAGVYACGFLIYLVYARRWRHLLLALAGLSLPFLYLNLITGFASMTALLKGSNLKRQFFNTPMNVVIFKFFSTGMYISLPLSVWAAWRDMSDRNVLFFCLSSVYVIFAVVTMNAHTAGFPMMQSVLFSSFLIAQILLMDKYPGGIKPGKLLAAAAIVYILITTAITVRNLSLNTIPVNPRQEVYKKIPNDLLIRPGSPIRPRPIP